MGWCWKSVCFYLVCWHPFLSCPCYCSSAVELKRNLSTKLQTPPLIFWPLENRDTRWTQHLLVFNLWAGFCRHFFYLVARPWPPALNTHKFQHVLLLCLSETHWVTGRWETGNKCSNATCLFQSWSIWWYGKTSAWSDLQNSCKGFPCPVTYFFCRFLNMTQAQWVAYCCRSYRLFSRNNFPFILKDLWT